VQVYSHTHTQLTGTATSWKVLAQKQLASSAFGIRMCRSGGAAHLGDLAQLFCAVEVAAAARGVQVSLRASAVMHAAIGAAGVLGRVLLDPALSLAIAAAAFAACMHAGSHTDQDTRVAALQMHMTIAVHRHDLSCSAVICMHIHSYMAQGSRAPALKASLWQFLAVHTSLNFSTCSLHACTQVRRLICQSGIQELSSSIPSCAAVQNFLSPDNHALPKM